MTRARVVTGAAAAALVLGVLAVRGGTAVDPAGLVEAAPPSPSPSATGLAPRDLLLEANGLPGLRLGTSGAGAVTELEQPLPPAGCRLGWGVRPGDGSGVSVTTPDFETSVWVVEDQVVSVVLNLWSDEQQTSDALRTWLGPTLGSPLVAAQELPGARTSSHTTFGGTGPTVSVVTVPLDGVEVVFGDAPTFPGLGPAGSAGDDGTGRITSIELRRPAARACASADLHAQREAAGVVDADGVGQVRLGAPVQPLLDDGLLLEETATTSEPPPCRSFWAPEAELQVVSQDDVVVSVQAFGVRQTSFGVSTGDGLDAVRQRFPGFGRSAESGLGPLEVEVGGNVVRLEMYEGHEFVPDLERAVVGGPRVVQGILVMTPEAAARAGDAC